MGKFVEDLDRKIQLVDKAGYKREQYQSFMTGPEWRNVEMAEEYAEFLREGKSMFRFPYFRQVFDLWKVIYRSYSAARTYNSPFQILFSEYMMMDLFIGFFTTVELIPKGIISLFLYPFLNKQNNSTMQRHLADYYAEYSADLQTIPFYDHKYKENREKLAQAYQDCPDKTWGDWFSWKCISAELWARRWISKPLSYWFHQEGNLVEATTEVLVKLNVEGIDDPELAKEKFREKLRNLGENLHASIVQQDAVEHLYVKEKNPEKNKSYISVYAVLKTSRYADFQPTIRQLSENGIKLRKIAGQDHVQVKCFINTTDENALQDREERLKGVSKAKPLYAYGDRIHSYRKVCLFDVPVRELPEVLTDFDSCGETVNETESDVKVKFIHNF
ncbi:hypothetical protein [Legionella brunensis]|uniref:Uncharacterized protein n=1 Tax=Legionella brunensis TaxID=29422 RepID=A0A0W0S408_9GAMM|nr:hypothetical protein [Legionella brunensis]KTC78206.1 hypothetical protein Lbru_2498 [Legionella brunensis]